MAPRSMSQMFQQSYTPVPQRASASIPQPAVRIRLNREDSNDDWGDRGPHNYSHWRTAGGWRNCLYGGGLGKFIFSTSLGWELFIGLLVVWTLGCGILLTIINRTILWSAYLKGNYTAHTRLLYLLSGVCKFPYPITTAYIQLVLTHVWITLAAYATRWKGPLLESAGLAGMIAPSGPSRMFGQDNEGTGLQKDHLRDARGSGGIAGGGFFEFEISMAKRALPLAVLLTTKTLLSTISSNFAQYPVYVVAQIGLVPFSLLFTYRLGTNHNGAIMFSSLAATLALGVSIYHPSIQYSAGSIIAGVFSSLFAALYPLQISRTHQSILASLDLQGDFSSMKTSSSPELIGSKERAKTFWLLLHYTSSLSIILFTIPVIFSGELLSIWRNLYKLDGFFFWLMAICGSLMSCAVLLGTIALTTLTSPLSATFLFMPEASILQAMMTGKRLPARSWIALSWCWVGCCIFLLKRWEDGRRRERAR